MTAPIPQPVRARPNLARLLYDTPSVSVNAVQTALETVFPRVIAEERKEVFFQHQLRCGDEGGRNRLIVRFGWSPRRDRWIFEALPGDRA